MNKYEILVYLNDNSILTIITEYEKLYELQTVITNYGKNGVWDLDKGVYYPAHRIEKIELSKKIIN